MFRVVVKGAKSSVRDESVQSAGTRGRGMFRQQIPAEAASLPKPQMIYTRWEKDKEEKVKGKRRGPSGAFGDSGHAHQVLVATSVRLSQGGRKAAINNAP